MLPSALHKDRRSVYRVVPQDLDDLEVSLETDNGEALAYEIVDVNVGGIGARFPYNNTPPLAIGDEITLAISSPRLQRKVKIQASVMSAVSMSPMRYYSFEFKQVDDALSDIDQEFFRLFNRRSTYRGAEPDPREPVTVFVNLATKDSDAEDIIANLRNISASGLGICADPEFKSSIDGIDTVEVTLRLSENTQPLKLIASIRYEAEHEGHICYGMKIDPNKTANYLDKAEEIVQYMLSRFDAEMHEVIE